MGPNFVLRRRTAPIGPIWITELGMFYAATEPAWRPRHRRRGSTLPGRVRLQLPTRRHEAVAPELGDEAIHCSSPPRRELRASASMISGVSWPLRCWPRGFQSPPSPSGSTTPERPQRSMSTHTPSPVATGQRQRCRRRSWMVVEPTTSRISSQSEEARCIPAREIDAASLGVRFRLLHRAREALHGEEGREGVRPDPEDYEPRPDDDQHVPAPPLDGWCPRPGAIKRLLPSSDHEERGGEQEADQHDGRHREGEECGAEPPGGQTLPGQTGQDRSRSPEPGQQVPEPEKDHPGARVAAAEPGLRPDDRSGDPVAEAVEGEGENLGLDEPQEDEPRSDRDAEDLPGGAGEGDRSRETPAPERNERSDPQDEDHGAERERGGHPDAAHPRASRP